MPREKPLLVLHVGLGKTGTTALQNFFWRNRRRLAEGGFDYPDFCVVAGSHHRLSPHVPPFLKNVWSFVPPAQWAPKLARQGGPLLLSSEIMSSAAPEVVREFAEILHAHFTPRIAVYVRRADNLVMAAYNQQIKAGTQKLQIRDALNRISDVLGLERKLRPWFDSFGAGNVVVRPYERGQFAGGDIRRDFVANVLGLEWRDDFVIPKGDDNPRLATDAIEVKRVINNIVADPILSMRFNDPLIAAGDRSGSVAFAESELLSGRVRRMLIERESEFYAFVARTCLGREGGELFLDKAPDPDRPARDTTLGDEAFRNLLGAILDGGLSGLLREQIAAAYAGTDPVRAMYAERLERLI